MSERVDTSEDLISFIVDRICNAEGGRRIEQRIAPYIAQAVEQCDALHYIPENDTPTAMIMFGASASGKSTLRPYLREMFQREGKNWDDTMRLSTDIFRRSLLEIDSLPEECAPYFSRFTSAELRVIDKQLDAYLIRENGRHNILIDRFREKQEKELDKEIIDQTKDVRLYFIVVPPEQTIENSWERGQRIGRYKSVEELLFHCYDAYINMPGDFFGWLKSDKNVHFEFLDKTVPEFSPPRMIMSGNKKEVTVESVQEIIQVNQFSKINLYAKNLSELY